MLHAPFQMDLRKRPENIARWKKDCMSARLNICTRGHVIYLSDSCHALWQLLSFSKMAVLQGFGFLFSGSQESAGTDWPHWSDVICMSNTPVAPWCWRGTLATHCGTAARSRVPELSHAQTHADVRSAHMAAYRGNLCHSKSCSMSSLRGFWWAVLCQGYSQDHRICLRLFTLHHLLICRKKNRTALVLAHSLTASSALQKLNRFLLRLPLVSVYSIIKIYLQPLTWEA